MQINMIILIKATDIQILNSHTYVLFSSIINTNQIIAIGENIAYSYTPTSTITINMLVSETNSLEL
jgi:hypothetical protein